MSYSLKSLPLSNLIQVRLSNDDAPPTVRERMHPYTSMVTIAMVGSRLLPYAMRALDEVNKQQIHSGKKQSKYGSSILNPDV